MQKKCGTSLEIKVTFFGQEIVANDFQYISDYNGSNHGFNLHCGLMRCWGVGKHYFATNNK